MIQVIASVLATILVRESGRPDSNRRSQAPEACGLARLSHALVIPLSSPSGSRTRGEPLRGRSALKGRYPEPIDERARVQEWAGALERPLDRLSYRPVPWFQQKRPSVFVTPGLRLHARDVLGQVSRSQGIEPERVRRRFGESLRFLASQDVTRTPGKHERPQ